MTTGPEVLSGGSDRPPRAVPRAWRALALGLVAVVAAGAAGRELLDRRAEQRARQAAFAVADAVHVAGRVSAVFARERGGGVLVADVQVLADGADAGGNVLRSVRLEGDGLASTGPVPGVPAGLLPTHLLPEAALDCAALAAGRFPTTATAVLSVLPDSGLEHEVRVDADPEALRETSLEACDLPDPDARTVVEASGRDGALLVVLDPVPRSPHRLVLRGVRVPGLEVGPPSGLALPHVLTPGTGGVYGLPLRVRDCAAARTGGEVVVLLEEGGRDVERVAGPGVSQPQPGQVPVAEAVRALVEEQCP